MKKVYKYATGQEIPEGAIYCGTVTQTKVEVEKPGIPCSCHKDPLCSEAPKKGFVDCWLVWHYFLVDLSNI